MIQDELKYCGKKVYIDEHALIINPEHVEIGDYSYISAFVKIIGSRNGTRIGRYNHWASFSSIMGGEGVETGDFISISSHCLFVTSSENYYESLAGTVPSRFKVYEKGRIVLQDHVILGANTTVLPGVTLYEGAATGAFTLVNEDLAPWRLYCGYPARLLQVREKDRILSAAEQFSSEGSA